MTLRRGEILLLAGSLGLTALAFEVSFRVAAYLRHRHSFEVAIARPATPAGTGSRVTLVDILRPSRNPRIVYELRPALHAKLNVGPGVPPALVETNAQGFRDEDYPVAKPDGAYRIVGIGDSMMFGWGVPQGRDYLSVAERRLNHDHPERSWQVLNTAVPGYNTVMEVETLKTRALAYDPDLVVVGYCGNDFDLPNFIWLDEPYLSPRTSFFARFVRERLARVPQGSVLADSGMQAAPEAAGGFVGDPAQVPARYRELVGWDAFARSLREVRDLGQQRGFRVALLVILAGGDGRRPRVIEEARRLGLGIVDAEPRLDAYMRAHGIASYLGSEMSVSSTDGHPSRVSHRLTAEALLQWMADQGVTGPVPPDEERVAPADAPEASARVARAAAGAGSARTSTAARAAAAAGGR